ncbi:MAG TPA: DNA polymerase III subunit delta [Actinomycetota bacterium]|nr:DNA polymerase III subunit delta [Actinomycetota bacterium]
MTAPVYLFTGHELLAQEALARLRAELGTDPLSEASFDASSPAAEIRAALETPSLLGGRRLVVVAGAQALDKTGTDWLAGYIESPSPSAVLVLLAEGRTRLADAVRRAGEVVALEAPRGRRLVRWIRDRGALKGTSLDDRAGWALVDAVGTELRDLDRALDQLATASAGGRARVEDVRRLFPRLADERIYVLTDAVGDRRLDTAAEALRRLLDQGEEPLVLFGAVVAHVRRLVLARAVASGGAPAVARALGLPEWRADRVARQARSFREEELVAAMAALAAADVEMKGGDLPPEIALERAVIEIVQRAPEEPLGR